MSQISQKSISGITSITSPAGTDDQISLHTSNTNEALKIDGAGNLHLNNHVNTTGVTTASNFKTGSSNLHSTGLTVGDTFVHATGVNGSSADIDDFISVGNNIHLGNAGVITATSFSGDGSNLTSLPAGLGTALSSTQTDPLNKLYYTNQVLGVGATVTVDPPASSSKAYTQYADIKVDSDADLIIAEGDDLIPDVLGLADFGNFGGGPSAGRIRVNSITNAAANGATTIQNGVVISGMTTITGGLSIGGTITYEDVTNIDSIGIITARSGVDVDDFVSVGSNIHLGNAGIITASSYRGDGSQLTGIDATTLKDSNGNVRVSGTLTGAVVSGILTATASINVKQSGNAFLNLLSTGTGNAGIYMDASNGDIAGSDYIFMGQQNDLNFVIQANTNAGHIDFKRGTDTKVRIDTSGRVLIGTTTEGVSTADDLTIASNGNTGITIRSATSDLGNLYFSDGTSGDAEYRGYVQYYHADDSMRFGTAGATKLFIKSDGKIGMGDVTPSTNLEMIGHNQVTFGSMPETIITYGTASAYNSGSAGSGIQFGGYYNSTPEYTIFAGVHGVKEETGNGPYGGALIISVRQNGTSSFERMRVSQHGAITNTTNTSHPQGAGTFNIRGTISQYSQGSGSGLIFDCDFGRISNYSDDSNVSNGTNLSAALSHSTTDWSSSSSNTPISVNGGTLQYRSGFGGYMEGISNGGRVSVGAGSGVPAMSDKLNTASMTIESWVWYDGTGREVIASRWGTGFPYQFNMICDPNGQFHFNNSGVGCGSGDISGEHFPDKTWHHHVWQYDAGAGTLNRWYINGAFANSYDAGTSLAVASGTGFGIFSRADRAEDWRGKIAIVRIYNRALSATEIKNHFELERGRFGV